MKKRTRAKILHHLVLFAICIALLVVGIVTTVSFNNKVYTLSLSKDDLFTNVTSDGERLNIELSEGTSVDYTPWESYVDDGTLGNPQTYQSAFINFNIKNITDTAILDYKIRFTAKEKCYFITGWCGTFEFHQLRDGTEKVQEIDFSNKPENDEDYVIDTANDDHIIRLEKNDYFIYIPDASTGMVPLSAKQEVTPGLIIVESKTNPYSFDVCEEKKNEVETLALSTNTTSSEDENKWLVVAPRGDAWYKAIDSLDPNTPNFAGMTFDMDFYNNTEKTISSYSIMIKPETTFYLASCWNGSVEIHQGDKIEYIKDLRTYDFENTTLTTIGSGSDKHIKLTNNDYFIYYPSQEYYEVPLAKSRSVNTGFILYQLIDEDVRFSAVINYSLSKNIFTSITFDIAIAGLFILLLSVIFNLLLRSRVKKLLLLKEHDEKIIVESIETFIGFIDAKDPYTNGHSIRVALYTKMLCEAMGLSEEEVNRIYYIALLHDCGKMGIPDSILCKPDKLTKEEFDIIKTHPTLGADILKNFTSIEGVCDGVKYHHERYDGLGYPEGKMGEDIPLEARIICVADSVDAMNSDRCYRKKLSKEQILAELKNNWCTQFDPTVCEKMIELIESGKIKM